MIGTNDPYKIWLGLVGLGTEDMVALTLSPLMFASTVTRALARLGIEHRGPAPFPRPPVPMLMPKADALGAG